MTKLTPAQERIIAQLTDKLVSYVGKSTDPAANTVHGPAVEALARKGLVEVFASKEQEGRRLARLVGSAPPESAPPPPAPPQPGGKGQRSSVRRKRAAEEKRSREEASKRPAPPPPRSVFDPEPEVIRTARARIKALIDRATEGHPPQAVHLVLAIVNQETGNHSAANALIREYRLDKLFGLRQFS